MYPPQSTSILEKSPANVPSQGTTQLTAPISSKEEWPSLSTLSIPHNKCVELPSEDSKVTLPLPSILPVDEVVPVPTSSSSTELIMSGIGGDEQFPATNSGAAGISKEQEDIQAQESSLAVGSLQDNDRPNGHSYKSPLVGLQASSPVSVAKVADTQIASPHSTLATTAKRPLTPNVRMSPAPSGDPKMTIIVENLWKTEPEEEVKGRFRAYGRLVSTISSVPTSETESSAVPGRFVLHRDEKEGRNLSQLLFDTFCTTSD